MIANAKYISILGAGESGVGAALLAKKEGYRVFVSDLNQIKPEFKKELIDNEIKFEEGKHDFVRILASDFVIKSPGIPDKVLIIKELKDQGTPIISEIEFASWYTKATIVAITGSNGKTTTTVLTHHLLSRGGHDVGVAGNLGYSLARMVAQEDHDFLVVEVSSFQLDDIKDFKPHIAVIVNITPDHLDRYNYNMEEYIASKMRITLNQDEDDFFIYNLEDPILQKEVEKNNIKAKVLGFTTRDQPNEGAYINEENKIEITLNNHETMTIDELALQGRHNVHNSMAAALSAKLLKIRKESIRDSLANFDSLEHRLEPVLDIHGIEFVNDSKATNVNSTYFALESMRKPTIWIVGGVDKGNDYSQLSELVKDKVKAIVCLGSENAKIHAEFDGHIENIVETNSMDDAVKMAYQLGSKGETVLLSPACASFDLFQNYEDRGRQFKQAVRKL
ncbi:MAG: UDP-N-acetylmuramoyl-L-alanine--D-glutamate ligase [Schleiferiaceae bacterium]|jgi:UDP-N-acetylmuramoylalanine--D-glutamate ligase|nr:UDP-N-acetylmuramoyl-L-alanine--D-glutamate ligase [Schleiferiaceae bacterium]